ncbi:hypothetical protein Desde_3987 [Desulfitobacterium dehalogenans ATCC 51507]|uniref:Uncharacterized protein n=1 Tax=Desulfitobacterium dehalogenans (strain ATCC 51507 / DSM 9161 / JW/IU-DC1) TaxID=756499 RepID=I4AE65_DESDJ|nr:hypothetical protein [Desulfitobacterium dehalogenans]AFM02250.1 hypothetical protein Desde_3987 [Desulfitobacterium dehalogenans ATCC 51507]
MRALHSQKLIEEKNAFINELYSSIPTKENIIEGELNQKARRLHEVLFPIYIMKHYNGNIFESEYFDMIISNLVEAESALILGLTNAGISSLRGALESSFKFLYYEYHPVENRLHNEGKHSLSSLDYREFFYNFPGLSNISFSSRSIVEGLWSYLCRYVHCDFRVLKEISLVSDISSVLLYEEKDFKQVLDVIKLIVKLIVSIFFCVDSFWIQNVEKAYFDATLEAFSTAERQEILQELRVA